MQDVKKVEHDLRNLITDLLSEGWNDNVFHGMTYVQHFLPLDARCHGKEGFKIGTPQYKRIARKELMQYKREVIALLEEHGRHRDDVQPMIDYHVTRFVPVFLRSTKDVATTWRELSIGPKFYGKRALLE